MTSSSFNARSRWIYLACTFGFAFCGSIPSSAEPQSSPTDATAAPDIRRAWIPEDSAALNYYSGSFGHQTDNTMSARGGETGLLYSPGGQFFAALRHRGDLARDANVYELMIWRTQEVEGALRAPGAPRHVGPFRSVTMSSSSNHPAISNVEFDESGRLVYFIGSGNNSARNVYKLNLDTGAMEKLTAVTDGVRQFVVRGGTLIYRRVLPPASPPELSYPYQSVGAGSPPNGRISSPTLDAATFPPDEIGILREGITTPLHIFSGSSRGGFWANETADFASPRISPDGRSAFSDFPSRQVGIVDTRSGAVREFAVSNRRLDPDWAPDGSWATLPCVVSAADRRPGGCLTLMMYSAHNGRVEAVPIEASDGELDSVRWISSTSVSVVQRQTRSSTANTTSVFAFDGSRWARTGSNIPAVAASTNVAGNVNVRFEQSINQPPVLVASLDGRRLNLTDSDPVVSRAWLAQSRPFEWREPNDKVVRGGLWLPRDYVPGRRLPLVIQTYGYSAEIFLPDGPDVGTEQSAQSLVARGFAVLQIDAWDVTRPRGATQSNQDEAWATAFVVRIDAIIDALDAAGIIDPNRVGASGFSQCGFLVHFAITHPGRHRLAAAIINDSFDVSLSEYLRQGRRQGDVTRVPFWSNRDTWLRVGPIFNLDKVRTPALFTRHFVNREGFNWIDSRSFPTMAIEQVNAYRLNNRPIEMLLFPRGGHVLQRPREQVALQYATIDWMDFWLNNHEDPDPAKAAQYVRWRAMRATWRRQQAWEAAGHPSDSVPDASFVLPDQ